MDACFFMAIFRFVAKKDAHLPHQAQAAYRHGYGLVKFVNL
jgi:hypothetical protein